MQQQRNSLLSTDNARSPVTNPVGPESIFRDKDLNAIKPVVQVVKTILRAIGT